MSHAELTTKEVLHVAKLSRLAIDGDAVEGMRTQLSTILGHIAQLQAVAVDVVEPMAHPLHIVNRLDADEPKPAMDVSDFLRNAPATEGRFLAVPKVLADGGDA